MTKDDNYSGENYDQVVYYVAPAVLVAAILFCCFRMALVYYMQIRPRRGQTSTVHASSTRDGDLQAGSIPTACQDIFLRIPPPPTYDQMLKNDRRCMSAVETSTTQDGSRQPNEVIVQVEEAAQETQTSDRPTTTRDALRRAQSNIEASPPASSLGPPAYFQRQSSEDADSRMLSPQETEAARLRLPSYEEAVIETESRRPTLNV